MLDLEAQLREIMAGAEFRLGLEGLGIYTLHNFRTGDPIVLDLPGECVDGVQLAPDERLIGTIQDSEQGIIDVQRALHTSGIAGHLIGVAMRADTSSPTLYSTAPTTLRGFYGT